jgi:1-acyl-sn-glycerol-3-phosphate acyltransferase
MSITAGMLPPFLAHLATCNGRKREEVRDAWVRRWARTLLRLFAIEVVIDGPLPPSTFETGRGRLVVANHRSAIDIGVVLATFGGTMVSRADVAAWPVLGAAARAVGTVFVDRASANSRANTVRAIQAALERTHSINVFPEGTTFADDTVRPFHGGTFVSAVRAGADILPIGLVYPAGSGAAFTNETFPAHLARLAKSPATRMVVAVGTPFVPASDDRPSDVRDRAHNEVQALVERARARCGA